MTVPYIFANQAGPIPLSELDANFTYLQSINVVINVKSAPYNAAGDGVTNDMPAFIAAVTAAGLVGGTVYVPAGKYLLNTNSGSIPAQNCAMQGPGVWCLTQPYEQYGACLLITGTVNPPFLVQNNFTFSGINILYPDQKNPINMAAVITYPATFQQNVASAGVVALQFENCMFFNLFDGFNLGTGNPFGPVGYAVFSRCAMYAINRLFKFSFAPTPIFVDNCAVGYGLYGAYDIHNALRDYSKTNGSVFYIYGDGTTSAYPSTTVEGLFVTNSTFGGYRYCVKIDGGALGSAIFNGCALDGFGNVLSLTTAGAIATSVFADCWLDTDNATGDHPAFEITAASPSPAGSIISDFTIDNCRTLFTPGGFITCTTAGKVRSINVRNCNLESIGTDAGTQRLTDINEPNCLFIWENNRCKGYSNTSAYGINLTDVASGSRISDNWIDSFFFPISTVSANKIYIHDNTITNTNAGSGSVTGTGTNVYAYNNSFDRTPTLTFLVARNNVGYVTENKGATSILNGSTSIVVTHGLSVTPTAADIHLTMTNLSTTDPGQLYVDTITSAQFTIHCRTTPGASNLNISWQANVI